VVHLTVIHAFYLVDSRPDPFGTIGTG
jgi:hypothetical protein